MDTENPATTRRRCFIIWPVGNVEEVDADGDSAMVWQAPDLFAELVTAGFPLHGDLTAPRWDGIVDLSVDPDDPTEVVVYTSGPEPREHRMGEASVVFLRWYHANA